MNLQSLLAARVQAGRPVRVGLIGAGKFGSMFLAQVPSIAGLEVALVCDRDIDRAKAACRTVGWDAGRIARTRFSERGRDTCLDQDLEVVVEATGDPAAGIAHALAAIEARKPIVMVNVESSDPGRADNYGDLLYLPVEQCSFMLQHYKPKSPQEKRIVVGFGQNHD